MRHPRKLEGRSAKILAKYSINSLKSAKKKNRESLGRLEIGGYFSLLLCLHALT
jgi:hypothetical protein